MPARIKGLKKTIRIEGRNPATFDSKRNSINLKKKRRTLSQEEDNRAFMPYSRVEAELEEIRNKIKKTKFGEQNRIQKAIINNTYKKSFGAPVQMVYKGLFGEEEAKKLLEKIKRVLQVFFTFKYFNRKKEMEILIIRLIILPDQEFKNKLLLKGKVFKRKNFCKITKVLVERINI